MESNPIAPGERVRLSGGYDMDPRWLAGKEYLNGTVQGFIPGQNALPACVVTLDDPIDVEGCSGVVLVLELRYAGSSWQDAETVHVELCSELPESKRWQDRRQGKWVESHARYERVQRLGE